MQTLTERRAHKTAYMRGYRLRRIASGRCVACPNVPMAGRTRCEKCSKINCVSVMTRFRNENRTERQRRNDLRSVNHYKAKYQAFNAYGGCKCACCGETEMTFLSIDHVNDDGAKHRAEIGGTSTRLYRWLRRKGYPPGFRVLCYNCNFGRYHYGGTCPHQRVQREEAVS